eukprot:g1484.t1
MQFPPADRLPGFLGVISGSLLAASTVLWFLLRRRRSAKRLARTQKGIKGDPSLPANITDSYAILLSNSQGVELYVQVWRGEDTEYSKGVVLLLHSYLRHSNHFQEFAEILNKKNFCVVAFDMQSQGRKEFATESKRDVHKYEDLVKDVDNVLQYAKQEFPNLPIFLIGEEFGATIALQFSLQQDHDVEGMVLCSPMTLTVNEASSSFQTSSSMTEMQCEKSESLEVNGDKECQPNMVEPPTDEFFAQVQKCIKDLEKNLHKLTVPFLTLHGQLDYQILSSNFKELVMKASSVDKELVIYDNMDSQLLHGTSENKRRVFQDIVDWIENRTIPQVVDTSFSLTDLQRNSLEAVASSHTESNPQELNTKQLVSIYDRLEYNGY